MSTQLSTSDKQQTTTTMATNNGNNQLKHRRQLSTPTTTTNNKRDHFVRSASIDKIIKFNAYICSQNFYILPALLAWLKSSSVVSSSSSSSSSTTSATTPQQASLEGCIRIARSFAVLACNHLLSAVRTTLATSWPRTREMALRTGYYVTVAAIFVQLAWCLYTLSYALLPGGLIFQCVCLYAICHINFVIMCGFARQVEDHQRHVDDGGKRKSRSVTAAKATRRAILGNRTISNFNLF